ncbi:hypothetical protein [Aquimarina longa]|uniref:hypothetical protein n=1 Tax=Aquimarina longa TaxID=1080221 RepID=UPI0011DFAA28|nr:hypothetical protein [Aquimarina longa]
MNWKTIMKFTKWIEKRLKDQATKAIKSSDSDVKIFASFLIILSGVVLFTDKITDFGINETLGFEDTQTMIWILCQTLSPLLLCIGGILKPYKLFYSVPLYLYFIQFFWIFNPSYKMDDFLLHVYAIGFCIGVFLFLALLIFFIKKVRENSKKLIFNIRKLTSFILFDIRNKYINKENRKEFAKDVIDFNKTLK